jgi:hypothetical protein
MFHRLDWSPKWIQDARMNFIEVFDNYKLVYSQLKTFESRREDLSDDDDIVFGPQDDNHEEEYEVYLRARKEPRKVPQLNHMEFKN